MRKRLAVLGTALLGGCAALPDRPLAMHTVSEHDLCLCVTADPPRADPERCRTELSRRGLTCDPAYWADFWVKRQASRPPS